MPPARAGGIGAHGLIAVGIAHPASAKHQIPNPKHQIPSTKCRVWCLVLRTLVLVWSLELGAWCFVMNMRDTGITSEDNQTRRSLSGGHPTIGWRPRTGPQDGSSADARRPESLW